MKTKIICTAKPPPCPTDPPTATQLDREVDVGAALDGRELGDVERAGLVGAVVG